MCIYGPNVGRNENDDGERAEPGVSDGEENVSGDARSREIFQGDHHHTHCERQRYKIEHPHYSSSSSS
jgi:hypothetical protein